MSSGKSSVNTSLLDDQHAMYKEEPVIVEIWQENLRQSTASTAFNITKCFVGAASFELPYAFMQGGWLLSALLTLLLAFISYYTIVTLTKCGHLVTDSTGDAAPTYPTIGRSAFGLPGAIAGYFGIFAMTIGVVGSYLVFIGSAISSLVIHYEPRLTPQVMTLIFLPVVVLLSWLRSYKFLAPSSLIGVFALLASVVISLIDGFTHHTIQPISSYPMAQLPTLPLFLGNAAFLYLIHSTILPTEQSMRRRETFPSALKVSMAGVTVLNIVFALLAYFLYGSNTQGNVIDNMTPGTLTTIVKIALALDLLCSSVLFLLPPFELFERALWSADQLGAKKTTRVEVLRNVLRTFVVGVAAGIALGIPKFEIVSGLSGGFGNALLGLVFPPLFFIRLQHKRGYWRKLDIKRALELSLGIFVFVFGVGLFFFSTIFTIREAVIGNAPNGTNATNVTLAFIENIIY